MAEPPSYRIDLDAQPESLSIVRLFVATVLRSRGVDETLVEDVKLAVSELATSTVRAGVERMSVTMHSNGTAIEIAVSPFAVAPDSESIAPDPVDIATSLFSNLAIDSSGGDGEARFSIELAAT